MNYWEILNVKPSDSLKKINENYYKILRSGANKLESDDYNLLRKAYYKVIEIKKASEVTNNSVKIKEKNINCNFNTNLKENISLIKIDDLLNEFILIYEDFGKRINVEQWQNILNDFVIKYEDEIQIKHKKKILCFLMTYKYVPDEVYELLNTYFNLIDKDEERGQTLDNIQCKYHLIYNKENINGISEQLDNIILKIMYPNHLSFKYLKNLYDEDNIKFEEYINLREECFYQYRFENKISDYDLSKCYDIYKRDPVLLNLYAEYCFKKDNEVIRRGLLIGIFLEKGFKKSGAKEAGKYIRESLRIDSTNDQTNRLHNIYKKIMKNEEREYMLSIAVTIITVTLLIVARGIN